MKENAVVHVINDDVSVRESLDGLLSSVKLASCSYASVRQFLDSYSQDAVGCIVLDVRLPGISGLDFQAQLSDLDIHLLIVMMSGHGDVLMSVCAMKAGAVDFLPKPFRDQDMIDAVMNAIERDRKRRAARDRLGALRSHYATLSPREQHVMALVTSGKLNKQVAGELGVSEATVKIHRGSAMRKMGAGTVADLVRMADALCLGLPEARDKLIGCHVGAFSSAATSHRSPKGLVGIL